VPCTPQYCSEIFSVTISNTDCRKVSRWIGFVM